MFGVVSVRALVAGLFLIQVEVYGGGFAVLGAIGVKLGVFAASHKPLERKLLRARRITRCVPALAHKRVESFT